MATGNLTAIDLFCGAGGLSYGFEKAGFQILAGFDLCEHSLNTFAHNHCNAKPIKHNLSEPIANIKDYKGVDIVIGGPPCQGFSISGKRQVDDKRNDLYKAYLHTLSVIKPKMFLMENVPNLKSMGGGVLKDRIIKDLSDLGYNIEYAILNASDFGVPQNRKRIFFIGCADNSMRLPEPVSKITKVNCKQAISDLPEYSLQDGQKYVSESSSTYQKLMRRGSRQVWNHQATEHKEKTTEIIALVPDGGNYKDLPDEYKHTRKVNIAWTRFNSNKPSFTIDTGHRHHFHYSYNRVPTVRESARLQSFPDTFKFFGPKTYQYAQVGNAVPPLMAEKIALHIQESM